VSESRGQNKGAVLRLRNLAMIENIRRAEDPAWTEALERQQTVARLGRRFRGEELSLEALLDYRLALKGVGSQGRRRLQDGDAERPRRRALGRCRVEGQQAAGEETWIQIAEHVGQPAPASRPWMRSLIR